MSLTSLPPEILLKIISLLQLQDVARIRQSCSLLQEITRDRHIWLLLLHRQRQYYPIPFRLDLFQGSRDSFTSSTADIERAVVTGHRIALSWPLPRAKSPIRAQPKMGDMLISLEMVLDRWLLIVYAEGAMYLWDTLPNPGLSSLHASGTPRARICATLIEKGESRGAMWLAAASRVTDDGRLIVALNTRPTPSFCHVYEVALRHDASFKFLKTVPLSTPEVIKTLSYSDNMLILSRGSSLNLVDISEEPKRDLMIVSPHSEGLEDMWDGIIDICLCTQYIIVFKMRSIEIHDVKTFPETSTEPEIVAIPIAKHFFPNTTFREIRFSTPIVRHDLLGIDFNILAYDVLQGLFHYSVRFHSRIGSSEIPPFLTVTPLDVYALSDSVIPHFPSHPVASSDLLTPSPTPTPSTEFNGAFRQGVNLSSRGFISAYAFGSKARRAVWVQRIRGNTIREIQVWSDSSSAEYGGLTSQMGSPRGHIGSVVVYSISSPDLREDIVRCTLSESTGLIILGNRAGEVFLLDVEP